MFKKLVLATIAVVAVMGGSVAFGSSLVLCSPFNGTLVTSDGSPVSGVRITRTWDWAWAGKSGEDQAVTADDGTFSFGQVNGSSMTARFMPHSPDVRQKITAETASGPLLIYSVSKRNYDLDSEILDRGLTGPGINLVCRADVEPSGDGPFWGTCLPAK